MLWVAAKVKADGFVKLCHFVLDDRHTLFRTHVNRERLSVHVAGGIYRHQSLLPLDSSDDVFNRHDALNGGKLCRALGCNLASHDVRSSRRKHPRFDDVSNCEDVRGIVQSQVVVNLDKSLLVESSLNHRVRLRILERLGVRTRACAPIHLARGKCFTRVGGVRL